MARQIFAMPDNNGIIRIRCGDDMFEIHVISTQQNATSEAASDPAGLGSSLGRGRIDNPFELPSSYIVDAPRKRDGRLDIEKILEGMRRQRADPNKPDPDAIVLGAAEVDLHELRHLGDRVAEDRSGISLGGDFSGSLSNE